MNRLGLVALTTAIAVFACGETAMAKYTFDFESGLDGWEPSGFGNGTEFVNLSGGTGATGGSADAMAFGHDGGNFSWDASIVFGTFGHPLYQTLTNIASDPTGETIEFDLTYVDVDLPTFQTFANLSVSLQSDAGFKQVDGVAQIGALPSGSETIHVSLPLDSGGLAGFTEASSFYRVTLALNTDGSLLGGTSTVYVDNVVVTPEPTSAILGSLGLAGLAFRRRRP